MTLMYELDIDFWKMYPHTKNKVSRGSRGSGPGPCWWLSPNARYTFALRAQQVPPNSAEFRIR